MFSQGLVDREVLQKGKTLFREGDGGHAAYIVESGSIVIRKAVPEGVVDLATLGPGELFGEMAIIDGSPRMASAEAREATVLIKIPRNAFEAKLKGYDPFMQALVKILVDNLRGVHRAYMRRPRSIQDYLTVIASHTEGMRVYLAQLQEMDPDAQALQHLDVLEGAVADLLAMFGGHEDRRRSVITDTDLKNPMFRSAGKPDP